MRTKALALIHHLGVAAWLRRCNRGGIAVLMYHGVLPDDEPLAEGDWLQVRESEFDLQMRVLRQHYEVIRLKEACQAGVTARGKPRAVITFDDGYANNLYAALPILQRYALPATVFVATRQVDSRRLFWWDRLRLARPYAPVSPATISRLKCLQPELLEAEVDALLASQGRVSPKEAPESHRSLTAGELLALKASGLVDIGSHTHGHEILDTLPDDKVRETLAASVRALAEWGCSSDLFAAPNGDYQERQISMIAEQGFSLCVSTQPGLWYPPDDCYRIPRFGIGRGVGEAEFALTVSGAIERLRRWRRSTAC